MDSCPNDNRIGAYTTVFSPRTRLPFSSAVYLLPPRGAHGRPGFSEVLAGCALPGSARRDHLPQDSIKAALWSAGSRLDCRSEELTASLLENAFERLLRHRPGPRWFWERRPSSRRPRGPLLPALPRPNRLTTCPADGWRHPSVEWREGGFSTTWGWLPYWWTKLGWCLTSRRCSTTPFTGKALRGGLPGHRQVEYRQVAERTLLASSKERCANDSGGSFSALDADSEGPEGRFWPSGVGRIDGILGQRLPLSADYYDVTRTATSKEAVFSASAGIRLSSPHSWESPRSFETPLSEARERL